MILNKFESLTNLANGPIIFMYYAESELASSTLQYAREQKTLSFIGSIFLSLHRKNCFFCSREQPNLFIQQYSLNIMDVLHHKMFGCSAVYDKDFLRRDEIGGFWAKNGQNLDESGDYWAKNGQNLIFLPR